ncbi:MAG: hypothetical protein V1848_03600 [Candidatus Magasanikbacteria bacterium]
MLKYIVGIGAVAFGFFMVIKTEWFVQNLGTSAWAEEHMGTRMFYKLVGLTFIVGAVLLATGALGDMFLSIFGRLFGL